MKIELPRIGRLPLAALAVAVVLLVVYAFTVKAAQDYYASSSPDRSVFNTAPMGLSIWYRYMEEMGLKPKALRSFDRLPPDAVVVVAGPFENAPSEAEIQRLGDWVSAGGRLVLVGVESGALASSMDLRADGATGSKGARLTPQLPSVYSQGIRGFMPGPDRLTPAGTGWVGHFRDPAGMAVMSVVHGKGSVTWLGGAFPVSNEGIGEADNAAVAVALAGAGRVPVYFDEYHHGYVEGQGVWDRLDASGRWTVVLAALSALVLVLALGRRVGPPVPAVEERAARTTAYIATLADLYRRAGARGEALESLEEGLKRALVRRYGTVEGGLARQGAAGDALRLSGEVRARRRIGSKAFLAAALQLRRARQEVEGRDG